MPSLSDLVMVGETCSAYEPVKEKVKRSCESCRFWTGEDKLCQLDIFWDQLTSLDQT